MECREPTPSLGISPTLFAGRTCARRDLNSGALLLSSRPANWSACLGHGMEELLNLELFIELDVDPPRSIKYYRALRIQRYPLTVDKNPDQYPTSTDQFVLDYTYSCTSIYTINRTVVSTL